MSNNHFESTNNYIATEELSMAVNAAITLERPLLIKGEPGTGKTQLALEVAKSLDAPLIEWHIKSSTKAHQGLYEYDAVSRLRDSQLGDDRVHDISNYIVKGKVWEAFASDKRAVLLIDEIDKADIEFPNDLLQELDRMEFFVYETQELVKAKNRPLIIITSNNEKELPDAFLIVNVHFPTLKKDLLAEALGIFFDVRDIAGLKKKPSTSELLDWIKLLLSEELTADTLREANTNNILPKLHGALLKNEQDVHLFERIAFINRRKQEQ